MLASEKTMLSLPCVMNRLSEGWCVLSMQGSRMNVVPSPLVCPFQNMPDRTADKAGDDRQFLTMHFQAAWRVKPTNYM